MPMIRMTTRSSIRVKPFSLWARSRSLLSMWVNPPEGIVGPVGVTPGPWSRSTGSGSPADFESVEVPLGFAPRPHERFALNTSVWLPGISAPIPPALTLISLYGVLTRRMIVLVLVLMGLTALVATVAPPERRSDGDRAAPGATPAATARPEREPDVTATLSSEPGRRQRTVRAELGDRVAIVVDTETPDSVALGDLDVQPAEPGVPARFELLADTPGSYPVVLMGDERRIATLVVR